MAEKRLRFYNGQFLQEQDFTAEQEYHLDRQRRHNRQLHTYGIAEGLTVTAGLGATSAVVSSGTAIDGEGRTIVLTESRNVPFNGLTGAVLVVISYAQQPSDPATVGDEGNTRWWERPDIEVIAEAGAPPSDVRIRLARLQIAGNNTVSSHDTSVRTSAGVKLGTEVSLERIRLARQGVDQTQWPVLSSGAASQADVTGNLSVSGTISGQLAAGIVGNAQLANLSVTSGKLADLAVATGKIADLAVTTGKLADNSVTAAKILDGAVGNTKLGNLSVSATKIVDATINEVKFDGATRGKLTDALPRTGGGTITGNLSVSGNLDVTGLINGFSSANRYSHSFSFTHLAADGATSVATPGFRARMIVVHGSASAVFNPAGGSNFEYGGVISGIALIGPTGTVQNQDSSGPFILRYTTGNFEFSAQTFANAVAGAHLVRYYDEPQTSAYRSTQFTITVHTVTATQVTFRLSRQIPIGTTALESGIVVNTIIFG